MPARSSCGSASRRSSDPKPRCTKSCASAWPPWKNRSRPSASGPAGASTAGVPCCDTLVATTHQPRATTQPATTPGRSQQVGPDRGPAAQPGVPGRLRRSAQRLAVRGTCHVSQGHLLATTVRRRCHRHVATPPGRTLPLSDTVRFGYPEPGGSARAVAWPIAFRSASSERRWRMRATPMRNLPAPSLRFVRFERNPGRSSSRVRGPSVKMDSALRRRAARH